MRYWKRMRSCMALLLALALLLTAVPVMASAESYPFLGTTNDDTNMRSAPKSSASNVICRIPEGSMVNVIGASGNFYRIEYGGRTGYAFKQYVDKRTGTSGSTVTTPPPSATIAPGEDVSRYQVLQSGSEGSHVAALQEALIELGYLKGKADGMYGSATAQAVMAFQRKNSYPITGVVDANLQAFIFNGKPMNAQGTKTEVRTLPAIEGVTARAGDRGPLVSTIQTQLKKLGYYSGYVTGSYDTETVKAVRAFQKKNGLSQDGVCGAETQSLLLGTGGLSSSATPTPKPTATPTPLPTFKVPSAKVSKGSKGENARLVQQRLIELGYLTGKADGKFGTQSVKALKEFQTKNGLKADGVAGSGTYEVLFSHLALAKNYTPIATPVPTTGASTPNVNVTYEPVTKDNVTVIRKGSTGTAVQRLQQRLTQLGYYNAAMDGVCKADDVAAIRAFQRMNSLDADGVAGYNTQVVLYSPSAVMDNGQLAGGTVDNLTTLKKGMKGEDVRQLQERLIKLGYLTGKADGIYGTDTAEAVYNFQKRNGLVRDGVAGAKTLAAVYSATAVAPAPTATPSVSLPGASLSGGTISTSQTLKKGDVNSSVKTMQQKLIALGYLDGAADGNFGPRTYRAVVAFQKANALYADGIAGKKTIAALNTAGISNNGTSGPSASAPTVTTQPDINVNLGQTVRVSAENVVYEYWYSNVRNECRKYPYCTLYDPETGISWQVHMFSYGKHAEIEPLTAADTEKMYQVCGYQKWTPKPVWVIFADGTIRIATTHSVPHEVQHITDNNFAGHSCLHFPRTQAQVTAIGPYATSHQTAVDKAWAALQAQIN